MKYLKEKTVRTQGLEIRYLLLAAHLQNERPSYSILVELAKDHTFLPDVTSSYEAAEILFETFVCGCVTPVTARDVVDDWLLW